MRSRALVLLPPAQSGGRSTSARDRISRPGDRVRRYFGRKLVLYGLTFFVAATIDWLIPRFMPGDPVQSLVSRQGFGLSADSAQALADYYNRLFGLGRSPLEQFVNFWVSLAHGDLGRSVYLTGRPVTDVILS